MAVQDRPLDLRNFQDIVDEARRMIPKYCPEWTDHNVSDPGITLIELFAWMTEMILYQVNRVPDDMYERFLDMVGIQRRPPEPAIADVTLYLTAPQKQAVVVSAETEVATEPVGEQQAIVFATTAELSLNPPVISAVRAWRQGQGFEDYLPYVTSGLVEAPIFTEVPQEDDALYIGFAGNLWGYSLQLWLECDELEGAHIDPRDPPLEWEYYSGTTRDWARARLLDESGTGLPREPDALDPTHGLNRNGNVYLHLSLDSVRHSVDGIEATWIRVRYVQKEGQGYTQSPRIHRIRAETIGATVPARQAHFVQLEYLGSSDGKPHQSFFLRETPVLRRDVKHIIDARLDEDEAEWVEVEDFSQSSEDDRNFWINYRTGELQFGPAIRGRDGTTRQYGAIPRKGALLRLRSYYSGGGAIGNVGERTIRSLNGTLPFIGSVINYRPASGGLNDESLEQAKQRSLSVLKRSATAVTREDYDRLAEEVEGVGRAHCLTPDQDANLGLGTVRLLLVPHLPGPHESLSPEDMLPSPFLIQSVSAHLDERKSLGTVVLYGSVDFVWVEIDAQVYVKRGINTDIIAAQLGERLRAYLHPVEGRPAGRRWSFGSAVTESQVAGLLQGHPDVSYVERVRLRQQGEQRDASRVAAPAHGLIALARCYVLVEPVEEDV